MDGFVLETSTEKCHRSKGQNSWNKVVFLESDFSNSRPLALSFEETAHWYSTLLVQHNGTAQAWHRKERCGARTEESERRKNHCRRWI